MAGRSLTRVQGGVTDTIHINTDRFAGVRTMTSGHVYPAQSINEESQSHYSVTKTDDRNFRIVSDLANDGVAQTKYIEFINQSQGLQLGRNRVTFDVSLNGSTQASDIANFMFRLSFTDNYTALQTTVGSNTFDFEISDDGVIDHPKIYFASHKDSAFDITISNLKVTHNYEEITVDRTADSGGRTMTVSGRLSDSTTSIQVTVAGHSDLDGIYTGSIGGGLPWTQQGGNGKIRTSGYNSESNSQIWFVMDDNDFDPDGDSEAAFQWYGSGESPTPWTHLPSSHAVTIEPTPETLTVDRSSDRKGESRPLLSKVVGGAAAAYSLRDLNDKQGNNKVVRVRRASDNHERDFLAKEVSNGTLKNWVNTQTVLPLDIQALTADGRTGSVIPAKAAYSLRNLSSTYTGNVVDVRRSSDSTVQGFTASQVADGTLTSFVNVGNQYTGYPLFAPSAFARITLGSHIELLATNDWSMKFKLIMGEDSSNGYGILRNTAASNNGSMFLPSTRNKLGFTNDSGSFINVHLTTLINKGQPADIEIINEGGSGVTVKIDGVTSSSQTYIGDITFNSFANGRGRAGERVIFDVEVDLTGDGIVDHKYAGDGITNSNWVDQVGSNNGTILNSSYITAYNNEFTDGFASKWYDQSGNTNHATQTTPANQPKIVKAGILVDKGIDFDGESSQTLQPSLLLPTIQNSSTFVINMPRSTSGGYTLMANRSSDRLYIRPNNVHIGNPIATLSAGMSNNVRAIQTVTATSGGLFTYFKDGSSVGTTNYTGDASGGDSWVGSGNNGSSEFNGIINEIIVYDTDQTDNRTTIEANIGEYYSITGIPAYDNTVDGFVEAWYDQSGNSNDLNQPTALRQPKIVNAGSLILNADGHAGVGLHRDTTNTSSRLDFTSDINIINSHSFQYVEFQRGFAYTLISSNGGGLTRIGYYSSNNLTINRAGSNNFASGLSPTANTPLLYITFLAADGSASKVHINGSEALNSVLGNGAGNTQFVAVGRGDNNSAVNKFILLSELIIYATDQSANRPAIEANINNQYDIY